MFTLYKGYVLKQDETMGIGTGLMWEAWKDDVLMSFARDIEAVKNSVDLYTEKETVKKYRFWFDDEHCGISTGTSINNAFQYFLNFGFDYTDVISVEVED